MDIHSACDYIIWAARRSGATLSILKLQKLLYYAQAWHLALQGEPLFPGKFQAWPQGPVNREIYDRLACSGPLYSELSDDDISPDFAVTELPKEKRVHLDRVLQVYGKYPEPELQEMITHEAPWQEANSHNQERCEREIDEEHMRRYCTVQYLVGWHENNPHASLGGDGLPTSVQPLRRFRRQLARARMQFRLFRPILLMAPVVAQSPPLGASG